MTELSSDSAVGIGGHGFASHCRAISKSWLQATRVPMAGAILARVLPLARHVTAGDLIGVFEGGAPGNRFTISHALFDLTV
jgi:hypothetical protein